MDDAFDEFLRSLARREDGTYVYGFDPSRPQDFMALGTDPRRLKIVWNAAINACSSLLESGDYYWKAHDDYRGERPDNRQSYAEIEVLHLLAKEKNG